MFHYIEPTDELRQKKRVVQKLIKANKVDRGLGLTKPEAEKVDDLLKSCEDIETQGTIVLKTLSQSILRSSTIPQDSIQRFYVAIRKGLVALSRSTFKQTPLTDIQNLTDYRDSLIKLMVALEDTFLLLNEEMYGNEPLQGRTPEEYQAQTGKPYRPPVSAKVLSDSINKKVEKEGQRKKYISGILRLNESLRDYQQRFASINERLEITQQLIQAKRNDQTRIEQQNKEAMRNYEFLTPAEQAKRDSRLEANSENYQKLQRLIDGYKDSIDDLEQDRQQLPNTIRNIESQIDRLQGLIDGLPEGNTQPLSDFEYNTQLGFEKRAETVDADFSLVMKDLNIFINSLTDGLIRYSSGLSTQLSRSQVTNFRTPSQRAVAILGAGMYKDLTKGIHTRFL